MLPLARSALGVGFGFFWRALYSRPYRGHGYMSNELWPPVIGGDEEDNNHTASALRDN
jgi:hypothetical protein